MEIRSFLGKAGKKNRILVEASVTFLLYAVLDTDIMINTKIRTQFLNYHQKC